MSDHIEYVRWNGRMYRRYPMATQRSHRVYFQSCDAERSYLHRDVYEATHGPIPSGWHVHHVDRNPLNNDPANLEAVDPTTHASEHFAEREGREYHCDECGGSFKSRKWTGDVRWCSPACKERWRRRHGLAYVKPLKGPFAEGRRCEHCNEPYIAKRPWARFCSGACKQREMRRQRRDAA